MIVSISPRLDDIARILYGRSQSGARSARARLFGRSMPTANTDGCDGSEGSIGKKDRRVASEKGSEGSIGKKDRRVASERRRRDMPSDTFGPALAVGTHRRAYSRDVLRKKDPRSAVKMRRNNDISCIAKKCVQTCVKICVSACV